MNNIMNAKVYVSTYYKYASGSLAGKWLTLSKFESKNDFLAACERLHKNEREPEFMFQDYDNLPESFIDESYISDEIWQVVNELNTYDVKRREAFVEWCEAKGYEQDLESLKEFRTIKVKKSSLPHEYLLQEEYANIWASDKRMQEYCMKEISNCVFTSFGGLVVFEKQKIDTKFCFGYSDCGQGQSYEDAQKAEDSFGAASFLKANLKNMDEVLQLFSGLDEYGNETYKKLYFTPKYYGSKKIMRFVFLTPGRAVDPEVTRFYPDGLIEASAEDFKKCYQAQKDERAKFEKRLKSYLKKYGTSKLKTWTYWVDE